MLSRAERARRAIEMALRAVALVALSALLWRAMRPPLADGADVARGDLDAALAPWTVRPPAEMRPILDAAPDPRTRDWLRALANAGTPLRWSAPRPLAPSALVAEPAPEPYGITRVRFATRGGDPVTIGDGAGAIDTLPNGGTTELELAAVSGDLRAIGTTFAASTVVRDSAELRAVLVLGAAGWESKFTIAALEERGWRVAARLRVAPGVEVTQGPLGAIDTARYSAVVALDSTAAPLAPAIARYVRDGGGAVLAGNTARLPGFAPMAPGGVGRRLAGVAGAVTSAVPRSGLPAFGIAPLAPDAVALERRGASPVIAARRLAAGRVLQSGYDETWRWRMAGGDGATAAHREWWSRLVSAVAFAPLHSRPAMEHRPVDEAPLATLIAALGPPSALDARLAPRPDPARTTRILFAVLIASLLLEWGSRRLRGAR